MKEKFTEGQHVLTPQGEGQIIHKSGDNWTVDHNGDWVDFPDKYIRLKADSSPIMKIDCPACGFLNLSRIEPGIVEEGDDHATECECVRCKAPFYFIIEVAVIDTM